uniref:FTH domain-containing protein n=1 Tax=Caenorhabditis tropicalis TaxID=1561998 RepID=A0A1I7UGB2_9PELO
MKIFNLSVNSDENIVTWFHVAKGNQFRNLRIVGRSVFRLLDLPEITESIDVEIATSSSKDIKGFALQKLTKNRYLRLKFVSFHGRYHGLSEEIQQISLQNRPIGSVIDYCVLDFFRNKVYPNFARIETDLKAKRTKIDEKDAIKIPMKNNDAELVVFLIPDQYDKEMGSMWILRMMVTEKKQDN